jgi:LmbE family N-acetylglucosaminyl deacetylase
MSSEWGAVARAVLRAANALGSSGAENFWCSLASSASRGLWSAPRVWSTSADECVLWIAPHPDDEAMGGAGTLIRHVCQGGRVAIAVLTDGRMSKVGGHGPVPMETTRRGDARAAALRMGAELRWVGLPEGDWRENEGKHAILDLIAELHPSIIYAPSAIDFHPEHRRVARALASALKETKSEAGIRIYAVQVPITPLLVNLIHDVSDLDEIIRGVLGAYASQRESVEPCLRLRHYAARFYGAASQVEGFCELRAQTFVELHHRRQAAFRGLRQRAWSDPLAALIGTRERWAWRSVLHHELGHLRAEP